LKEIVKKLVVQFELGMLQEKEGWAIQEPTLNRLCPHVKPMQVKSYLEQCWA
jgi:hypothetical protein